MPQLDAHFFPMQLFWLAILFAVLWLLMAKLALPRVGGALAARDAKIDGDLAEAEAARIRVEALAREHEQVLAAARVEAQTLIQTAKAELAHEASQREEELGARLARQASEAEARIVAARDSALANVRQIAVEAAQAASSKLLGTAVPPAAAEAAVTQVMGEH